MKIEKGVLFMKKVKKIIVSFLLMCMLTDCPLAVFSEIWEKSYEGTEENSMGALS